MHCRFDGNAVFTYPFEPKHVSTRDYFHPNVEGEKVLAAVTWAVGYDFTDSSAPVSSASTTAADGGTTVTLTATDNVGVAGLEYRLAGGSWTRYDAPVTVSAGASITWRAVDVNGNIEATKSLTG